LNLGYVRNDVSCVVCPNVPPNRPMLQATRNAALTLTIRSLRAHTVQRSFSSSSNPSSGCTRTPIDDLFRRVYRSGTRSDGGNPRYERQKLGQPRVVLVVTGGGGQLLSSMLSQSGASSCILEAIIPYSKQSCLDVIQHRSSEDDEPIGFCSEDMAWRLALAARDRAYELEVDLNRWPDVHGVGMTATIVSHYRRRGGYRAHAAGVDARGVGMSYTHDLVKGHRGREGEDLSCALLAARALADSVGVETVPGVEFDGSYGVRLEEEERRNEVGEVALGLERIPVGDTRTEADADADGEAPYILVGGTKICAPKGPLPKEAIVMSCEGLEVKLDAMEAVTELAQEARVALGREGDGTVGSWAILPAPVLVVAPKPHAPAVLAALLNLENAAVLVMNPQNTHGDNCKIPMNGLIAAARAYPSATFVVDYNDTTQQRIDDKSPSTFRIDGRYIGTVTVDNSQTLLPHGAGRMVWENGIAYDGGWLHGMYHGVGRKTYSKGGGYSGGWRLGKRSGLGVSMYGGKWGYDCWEGPFVDDLPDGVGTMTCVEGTTAEFEFCKGEPVTK